MKFLSLILAIIIKIVYTIVSIFKEDALMQTEALKKIVLGIKNIKTESITGSYLLILHIL